MERLQVRTLTLLLVALCAIAAVGCGDTQAKATAEEEKGFRNPSKMPPAEAGQMAPKEGVPQNTPSPIGVAPGVKAPPPGQGN